MRLARLEIRQLPGVEAFRVDTLAPGVNLIVGPNAVGKSSLARALWHLVAGPRPGDPAALSLEAELVDAAGRWRVARSGRQIVWSRDGEPVPAPPLPDPDRLHCYWLRVEDLLRTGGDDDQALVELLRRELAGGYDLDAVQAQFEFGPRRGLQEGNALRSARQERQRIESRYQSLLREEQEVPRLEARAAEARAADARARQLEAALALLAARRERERLETELAAYPAGMERLDGRELQRLEGLETERTRLREALSAQRQRQDEAAAQATATGLAAERPEGAELNAATRRVQQLGQLDRQRAEARQRLAEREGEERAAAQGLGAADATPVHAGPDTLEATEQLAQRLHAARGELDGCRARLAELPAPSLDDGERPRLPWIAGLALAGAALAGVATVLSGLLPALAATALSGAAGGWAAWEAWRAWSSGRALRGEAEFIRRRRAELEQAVASAQAEWEAAREATRDFCRRHGIDPERFAGAGLDRLIRLSAALDQARSQSAAAAGAVERIEAELEETATAVETFLARWGAAPESTDPPALEAALEAFRERWQRAEEAARTQGETGREIERTEAALAARDAEITALFHEAGVEPGDRAELERRCALLERWQGLRQERATAIATEQERARRLADAPALQERAEAGDEAGLRAELAEQQTLAADYERLLAEANAIRTRLEEAGRDGGLERALAAERAAADELAGLREEALTAAAGRFLMAQVTREYRSAREPQVLQDAAERFRRFTRHAWSLELEPASGFLAREAASGERRPLSALSSGTRMQLLLAVRIAWARHLEREKTPLPLILDEALTTSDPDRFGQVAASLQQLAADEGRQVLYLTARGEDARLWEQATGTPPQVVDLAAVRFQRPAATPADYVAPPPPAVPAPEGDDPETYAARLGVPPLARHGPPEAIHLFHLLRDDLPLLHRLLADWRVRRLGELEALLASAGPEAVPDAAARARLAARCRVARRWLALWQRGRGQPVDRGVLETSGIVSETFIDRVSELADEVDGDAEALVAGLRAGQVARFRASVTDQLETWLRSEGYLDPEPPLAEDELLRALLRQEAGSAEPTEIQHLAAWLAAGVATTRTGTA